MNETAKMRLHQGVIHIVPLIVLGAVFLIIVGLTNQTSSNRADLVKGIDRTVLSEGSESSGSGSSVDEAEAKDDDDSESVEVRTDVRLPSGVRIRERLENGRRRIDVYEGGRKLRFETRDSMTVVKVEDEEEEVGEAEVDENEVEVEVESSEGTQKAKIKLGRNKWILKSAGSNIEARSSFPLSIDLATNELIVTTPAGVKRVAVLPQTAIDNMIRVGHVDIIFPEPLPSTSPEESPEGTPSASPEESPTGSPSASTSEGEEGTVELTTTESGEVAFVFDGAKREKLLGLFEILIPKTVVVSGETGDLVEIRQNLISKILDLLSS
ncbi:hypothetical protein HYT59_00530 [Candidatus Woesebacteria bacterium]|nr:hypothetical protein [Candidatus Woesebacteria bacterium]